MTCIIDFETLAVGDHLYYVEFREATGRAAAVCVLLSTTVTTLTPKQVRVETRTKATGYREYLPRAATSRDWDGVATSPEGALSLFADNRVARVEKAAALLDKTNADAEARRVAALALAATL